MANLHVLLKEQEDWAIFPGLEPEIKNTLFDKISQELKNNPHAFEIIDRTRLQHYISGKRVNHRSKGAYNAQAGIVIGVAGDDNRRSHPFLFPAARRIERDTDDITLAHSHNLIFLSHSPMPSSASWSNCLSLDIFL